MNWVRAVKEFSKVIKLYFVNLFQDAFCKKAAGVLVVDYREKVLGFDRADGFGYAIPCGKVEPGETTKEAAIRETLEETGYKVEIFDEEPYVGVVGKFQVTAYRAMIMGKFKPTHAEEGRAVWITKKELINGAYPKFNKDMLKYFSLYPGD